MATIRLNWSVKLRIVFGNGIKNDHELTENTTKHANHWFAFLTPAVSLSNLLLQYLIGRRDLADKLSLNLFA